MPYAESFYKMTVIGRQGNGDDFNWTMNFIRTSGLFAPEIDPTLLASLAGVVGTWFPKRLTAVGPGFYSSVTLTSLKVNLIGTDGKYVLDTTNEHVYTTPIAGGFSGNFIPQAAVVASVRTASERGLASKGRFYLPPTEAFAGAALGTDLRMSAANCTSLATNVADLVDKLNDAFAAGASGDEGVMRLGNVSNVRTGAQKVATGIAVGRVVDTIRSRRNKLVEDHQLVAIPA